MNASPLEKEIEKQVGDYAKKRGCSYEKFTSPARRAVPDRIITAPGGAIGFLELKREGQKPTVLQQKDMNARRDKGCTVAWVDNVQAGKVFVDMLVLKGQLAQKTREEPDS